MGEIAAFVIGGIVGVIVTKVGLEDVIEILKETFTEALPIVLGILGV